MNYLEELIDVNHRDRSFVECTTIGGVIVPLVKMEKLDLYLYGVASTASNCALFFEEQGVRVKGIIDQDESKKDKKTSFDVPYIHTSEIKDKISNPKQAFVVIVTRYFHGMDQVKILKTLIDGGFDKIYALDSFEIDQIFGTGGEWNHCKRQYFLENLDGLQKVYDMLLDDSSKQIMTEYLRAHIQCGVYSLKNLPTRLKYFYDLSDEGKKLPLYKQLDNEVWVNCGANIGDTIFHYFENGLKAKKIYAFEGEKGGFSSFISGLSFLPERFSNVVVPVNEYISDETGFEKWISEPITFLNADLDCHEMGMLHAMGDIIKKDRPVVAICLYHRAEDMIEIPSYISSLVNDYVYMIRKYDGNVHNSARTNELVLYAIPEERRI